MATRSRQPKTAVVYAYPKGDGYALAINPPGITLPPEAAYWHREREVVVAWVADKQPALAIA